MPQLDHESIGGKSGLAKIEKGLPAGEFNVVPPFEATNESFNRTPRQHKKSRDQLIIERWQKLSGLKKD
jgi:hypothetical protein